MHNAVVASHNIWVRAVEACSPHDFQASAPQCITIRALDALWRTLNLGGAQCTKPLKNGIPGYPTPTHHSYRNSPPPSSSSPIYLRLLSHYNPPPASSSSYSSPILATPSCSGAPPIGRQDCSFSAKMEEEVSRLMKGAQIV